MNNSRNINVLWVAVLATTMLTCINARGAEPKPDLGWPQWRGPTFDGVSIENDLAEFYFHLCRRVGLSIEWGFLTGFLPAFPIAALAAYQFMHPTRWRWLLDPLCAMASFSAYFAAGTLFIKWWLRVGS